MTVSLHLFFPVVCITVDELRHLGKIKMTGKNRCRLPSWMFSSGNTYEVAFYDGPTYNDLYSQLQQLTSNQSSWTTFPVKEYASGKTVLAADLIKMSGLKLSISAPSEVVGIGNIK